MSVYTCGINLNYVLLGKKDLVSILALFFAKKNNPSNRALALKSQCFSLLVIFFSI